MDFLPLHPSQEDPESSIYSYGTMFSTFQVSLMKQGWEAIMNALRSIAKGP